MNRQTERYFNQLLVLAVDTFPSSRDVSALFNIVLIVTTPTAPWLPGTTKRSTNTQNVNRTTIAAIIRTMQHIVASYLSDHHLAELRPAHPHYMLPADPNAYRVSRRVDESPHTEAPQSVKVSTSPVLRLPHPLSLTS